MQTVTILPAQVADIPNMARLWYEKMVLQAQFDRRFVLLPDSPARWSVEVSRWLTDSRCAVFVAERDGKLIGYIIGRIQPGPPGMSPEIIGAITELTIDPHSQEGGLGRLLLQPLHEWFAARGISIIVVYVPHRQAVEQAFWRALGATDWLDNLWIRL